MCVSVRERETERQRGRVGGERRRETGAGELIRCGISQAEAHQAGLDDKNTCKLTAAQIPTPQPAGCSG